MAATLLAKRIGGRQVMMVCGLGLASYIVAHPVAEVDTSDLDKMATVAVDVLTICTEAHLPDLDWANEFNEAAERQDIEYLNTAIAAVTEALGVIAKRVAEAERNAGLDATTMVAPGPMVAEVGSPAWLEEMGNGYPVR